MYFFLYRTLLCRLYFFGCYGTSWRRLENLDDYYFGTHEFLEYEGHYCWNNQLLEFDVDRNVWNKVEHAGSVPTQRAASSAVYVEKLDKVRLPTKPTINCTKLRCSYSAEGMKRSD